MTNANVYGIDITKERVDETAKYRHEWVGLTDDDFKRFKSDEFVVFAKDIEAILKERNN